MGLETASHPGVSTDSDPKRVILVGVVGNISACHADARGSIPRRGAFCQLGTGDRARIWVDRHLVPVSIAHTVVKPSHPVRSAKLSTTGSTQYYGGGPRGNRR